MKTSAIFEPFRLITIFGIFLILFLIFKIWLTGWIIGSDGLGYYAHLRSALIDNDFNYANEFSEFNQFGHSVPDPHSRTETDHVPNKYFVGPALLWTPFFLVAHILTLCLKSIGFGIQADGYSVLYQFFIGFGSITYGLIGLFLIYKTLLLFFSQKNALFSVILITLSTNVLYYLTVEPSMSHAISLFTVSLFIYIWIKQIRHRSYLSVMQMGLIAGLMILIRPQEILFSVLFVLELLRLIRFDTESAPPFTKRIIQALVFALSFGCMLIPQLIVWKIVYGKFLLYSYTGENFYFTSPHMLDSFLSANHGLISWTPIIFPSLIGFMFFIRKQPGIGSAMLIAFLLQWYLNASWWCWWFGVSYGNRAYICCSLIFAVGIASLITELQKRKWSFRLTGTALIVWNLLFISQYSLGMLPHEGPVAWKQVFINQYKVVGFAAERISYYCHL
jgi:hypothetical protein